MDKTRRGFLQAVVVIGGASLGGASLAGCGGDGGTDAGGGTDSGGGTDTGGGIDAGGEEDAGGGEDTGGGGGCASPTATIGTNHGHVLMVSAADVTAAVDRTYDITGSSMHSHSVTITAADFATLASGGTVTATSTSGSAHTHSVTVMCA